MSEEKTYRTLSRRGFLKTTAAVAGVAAAGGSLAALGAVKPAAAAGEEQIFSTICRSNCFQACLLDVHVRDGKAVKISKGHYPEEIYTGCCLRGLTLAERTYASARLKYPMKRKAGTERGAGEWERIDWDTAIKEIASEIKRIQTTYGPKAMAMSTSVGSYGPIQGRALHRLVYTTGGTMPAGMYDFAFGWGANRVMGGGTFGYSNEPKDMANAEVVIVWGTNPVWAQPQTWRILLEAKDRGAKFICIDILRSTTSFYCDEWMQINPGTDLYMVLALLNEVIKRDGVDREYMKVATTAPFLLRQDTGIFLRASDIEAIEAAEAAGEEIGFSPYGNDGGSLTATGSTKADPAYVMDADTGEIASYLECKNPVLEGEFEIKGIKVKTCYTALKEHMAKYTKEDAFRISGFAPEHFEELVDLYCSGKVITAYTQYGIDHYRGGHLFGQALCILHAITNNLSRPGSGVGGPGSPDGSLYPMGAAMAQYIGTAPIGAANVNNVICAAAMPEVYRTGKYMGQDYPIRGYMGNSENPVSNNANQNGWLKDILPKLELMVMLDNEMTDSCMYADYVLPTAFWLECTDVRGNFCNPYVVYGEKAIEPLFESKTDNEVASLIAAEMGLGDYYPMRTDEELIDIIFNTDFCKSKGITRENLKAKKAIRVRGTAEEPWIIGGYGEEFPTPSGRLELYCEQPGARYEYGQPWQAEAADQHFPVWLEPYENWPGAEIHKKYPLGYLQLHQRGRTHTQWITEPSLREIDPEPLCHMARNDAEARGLKTGDVVEVFNDRGHAVCRMVIDDKVCDGICYIPKGWQRFQFIAGGYQELTNDKNDLCAGGYSFYDAAVEVKKWEE